MAEQMSPAADEALRQAEAEEPTSFALPDDLLAAILSEIKCSVPPHDRARLLVHSEQAQYAVAKGLSPQLLNES